jgi:hypothetical protein
MIYTVTTIKDTTEGVERFVRRNLSAGADHMLLFLEADDASDQAAHFASDSRLTAIATDERYWRGERPPNLNDRQIINADLANNLLATMRWAEWLFHIDGDEVLNLDRELLESLPRNVHAVLLRPLEAVAKPTWEGPVTQFKRLLDRSELKQLQRLGVIEAATNRAYFRGHKAGKAGVRPSPFLSLRTHRAKTHHGANLAHRESSRLRLLHYESHTGAEFVRKWTNLAGGANDPRQRADRAPVAREVRKIVRSGLGEDQKTALLWQVFERYGADDVATLERLGLLVTPDFTHYEPRAPTAKQEGLYHDLLDRLLDTDKRYFDRNDRFRQPVDVVRDLADELRTPRPDLAARLEFALTR